MRLLHLVHTPRASGAEVLVALLAPRHVANGFETCVASLEPAQRSYHGVVTKFSAAGVQTRFPAACRNRVGRIAHILRSIVEFRPDVVFAHSVIPSAYARVVRMLSSIRFSTVTVLHDANQDDYRSAVWRAAEISLPRPASVVAVTNGALVNYKRRFGNIASSTVIQNAVDLTRVAQCRARARELRRLLLNIDDDVTVFANVGRYAPQKGQHQLIQAYSKLPLPDARCLLLLIGIPQDEAYERELRLAAKAQRKRIVFVSDSPKALEYAACADVTCMPSTHEAFSLAFVEALAFGVPIVASNIPGFEFAKGWPGVHLFASGNIDALAAGLASAVAQGGERFARELDTFTPEFVCRKYEALANSLIGKCRG